jgi:hypothetical protein
MTRTVSAGNRTGERYIAASFAGGTTVRSPSPDFMPAFIPADQTYYWTFRWQQDEARANADLAAGRFRDFDDPKEAVRHLLDTER